MRASFVRSSRYAGWVALLCIALAPSARAQTLPPPVNQLNLSSSGAVDVPQDLLTLSLSTSREGPDSSAVQAQLKAALDSALTEARRAAQPGQMDVRTGNFALQPRYDRSGKMSGWSGSVELILEGRDIARITQVAGRIQTLTLAGSSFSLSRDARHRAESEAQALAIERFKVRAADLARSFGFGGYSLREVSVNTQEPGPIPRPRMMAMEAKSASADSPVPVEAGRSAVIVTVSGSVQLR